MFITIIVFSYFKRNLAACIFNYWGSVLLTNMHQKIPTIVSNLLLSLAFALSLSLAEFWLQKNCYWLQKNL